MEIPLPKNFNPPKPLKIYDYQDIAIILFSSSIQAKQFSLKTFQHKDIIPLDWQLKKSTQTQRGGLIFSFTQGLNISISRGQIIFAKKVVNFNVDLAKVIEQFISKFENYSYYRSQIVLRRFITLPNKENSAAKFIQNNLLNGSQWKVLGEKPIRSQINYYYKSEPYNLTINVLDVQIKNKKVKSKSCLFFRGIFDYKFNFKHEKKQKQYIMSLIQKYPENIQIFNQIIEKELLNN